MYFIRFILRTARVLAAGALVWLFISVFQEERPENGLIGFFYAESGCIKAGILEGGPLEVNVDVQHLWTDSICVSLKILFKTEASV